MRALLPLLSLAFLVACGKPEAPKKSGPPPALITTTQVSQGEFEVVEETLGMLEVLADPKIGAEVAGRVTQVLARAGMAVKAGTVLAVIDPGDAALQHRADAAEAQRLEALAERQLALVAQGFLSQSAGENATAQRDVARARADISRRTLEKTQVRAPMDASVEVQIVAPGDYVKVGDPLFQLVAPHRLRAHLPFPESAAERIGKGMVVRLTAPTAPGKVYESRIHDIRPLVVAGSRSLDVLADIENDGRLRGGGTVNAAVVVSAKAQALTVPEQSVVLRPAGKVVYVVADGKARQHIVTTGAKRGGKVEVLAGLTGTETIALDGAGFLTDGAAVAVKQ
jgi:membrane fusion protein, multidrug efflux system